MTTTTTAARPETEAALALDLIERIVRACPRRVAGSEDERVAHDIVREAFEGLGLKTAIRPFEFNESLYEVLALHFGLGVLGTLVGGPMPGLGLALHLLSGGSYWLDSAERRHLLRRLLPRKTSQNLLAVLPAVGERKLRIVVAAHVDAAFTGLLFHPAVVRAVAGPPLPGPLQALRRGLAVATAGQLALAGVDLARLLTGKRLAGLRPLEWVATMPALVAFVAALEVVLRDEVVPGANDDLSGVAGALLLAGRLAARPLSEVEVVFAVTGSEEAGLGGALALAREMRGEWRPEETVILGLDSLCHGQLLYLQEGELRPRPVAPWLVECLGEAAAGDKRFAGFGRFEVVVGASDVDAFLAAGYDGVCLGCIDLSLGAPRHYHQPTDRPEALDPGEIVDAVDLAERLVAAIVRRRLGSVRGAP